MARFKAFLSALSLGSLLAVLPAHCMADSWKFEADERSHPVLSYSENGKVEFLLGCGRALGLHARYPGKAKAPGKTFITISNARTSIKLRGEFQEADENDATNFVQWDLGFSRRDPDLFGERWKRMYQRLLDLIGSGQPVTISSSKGSYRLPPPDVAGWKKALAECGA